ncbi:MAG: valine--tRNA ligase [Candidatus Sumerlaeaceae bacterium]
MTTNPTPELSTRYEPHATEKKYYPEWERRGYFTADVHAPGEPFCIVIPPPNITGILHMGHALNNTLQDVLTRWKRMAGYNALWLPGTDHASIATQYVVEQQLRKEGMERPREELGREKFLERVWQWKEKSGATIIEQLKRMGCSCDWSRERFTMDEGLSRAVRTVFARLYSEGLIYRDNYLVNWCPRCQTTLADDEVNYADKAGKLWYIKYPVESGAGVSPAADGQRFVIVATTRPETMLGDTAVAVNPTDERYMDLIGKHVILPLVERRIPIIADDFVDKEFGTGMVKITPAHDQNDYQAGKRHGLEEINILTPDAHINENGGKYAGLDRYVARKRVLEDLEAAGLVEKTVEHPQRVGSCYRCDTVIEPYLSLQWFVKMAPLAAKAREAVTSGRIKFHPESRVADFLRWIDNIRDWAISRQLWWGHQIPAFYNDDGSIVVPRTEDEYQAQRVAAGIAGSGITQDPDVLDTWFSSALWPFSTLGWPDAEAADLKKYYPTSVLSTGKDIIFFWVARMIMMGEHFMGEVPFRDVFFHPMVADEHGKKMSKSKGNAIDPTVLIEQFGTDAMRICLAAYASREQHIAFSVKELEGYRNFMNKLWNAARLILTNVADLHHQQLAEAGPTTEPHRSELALEDRWILSRYARTVRAVNAALAAFEFDVAVKSFREFFWGDFCDYYLELVKPRLYANPHDNSATPEAIHSRTQAQALLVTILEGSMRLLHPVCPFITEEIWQALRPLRGEDVGFNTPGYDQTSRISPLGGNVEVPNGTPLGARAMLAMESASIMIAPWNDFAPDSLVDEEAEQKVGVLQQVLYAIRNIRGEMRIQPSVAAKVLLVAPDATTRNLLDAQSTFLTILTNIRSLSIMDKAEPPAFSATAVASGVTIFVELPDEMRAQEIQRLEKEIARITAERTKLDTKLSTEAFTAKAPAAVIEKERLKLEQLAFDAQQLEQKLATLRQL